MTPTHAQQDTASREMSAQDYSLSSLEISQHIYISLLIRDMAAIVLAARNIYIHTPAHRRTAADKTLTNFHINKQTCQTFGIRRVKRQLTGGV